jgi:hypothetical protein
MKKLSSIELLHENGDSTIIDGDAVLDLVLDDVVEQWELDEKNRFVKEYACSGLHLEVLYHEQDSDKEAVTNLLKQTDISGFVLYIGKKEKAKVFDLPYLNESEEDVLNVFEVAFEVDLSEVFEEASKEEKLIVIDVSMDNIDFVELEEE